MGWIIFGIIFLVVVIAIIVLYYLGNKLQKKQIAQRKQMMEAAQPVTMLIIDKKVLPMKDAGLPKIVYEQTPKKYLKAKVPIVKARIGSQTQNLMCDDAIFDDVPTRGEVKAMVSGIYLVSVKSIRHKKKQVEPEETDGKKKKKKKGTLNERMRRRQAEYQKQLANEMYNTKSKEEIKAEKAKIKAERDREKKIMSGK